MNQFNNLVKISWSFFLVLNTSNFKLLWQVKNKNDKSNLQKTTYKIVLTKNSKFSYIYIRAEYVKGSICFNQEFNDYLISKLYNRNKNPIKVTFNLNDLYNINKH
uniref:Uncharacterized protein n=1 Tax=Heterorhabditis bacteriophora TaxID=37862 RepID=A0A1I7WKY1_HETBA